ncbi:hypothetical protein K490DRAFT_68532 [Saccharata proteae CBS 121410]|uniref:Uncharacterized protein n=1 Tax=Saccharata proteae CBS 121410 TaxID=1314787 RepID=A0A9P4HQ44_9PEZI|nr:hypothetical protein K490DRAFT_68532 [Saccharata proteae CBS 121410]
MAQVEQARHSRSDQQEDLASPAPRAPSPADRDHHHHHRLQETSFPSQHLDLTTATAHPPDSPRRSQQSLGLLSGLWTANSSTTSLTQAASVLGENSVPAPRTTGLRQLHATSWRSRLRSRPKSSSTATSVSSQPVLVRTYSGSSRSRPPSQLRSRTHPTMSRGATLPPADAFSFDGILRAVEPEIQGAIDAIAEICARSRLSLADEYGAHMPPQGEILASMPSRQNATGSRWWSPENTLTAVPEASSSSERLAAESRKSSSAGGRTKHTAYGSLRSIISGEGRGRLSSLFGGESSSRQHAEGGGDDHEAKSSGPQYWVFRDSRHPCISLIAGPVASPHVSLDTPSRTDITDPAAPIDCSGSATVSPSGTCKSGSTPFWRSWPRQKPMPTVTAQQEGGNAETRLKNILRTPSNDPSKPLSGLG